MAFTQAVAVVMQQMRYVQAQGQGGDGEQGGAGGRDHGPRRKIDTKMMRIRDFSGETAHWEAWVHSFKSAIRSGCPAALQTMEEVEKSSYDGTDDNLDDVEDVDKISGELYDILSQYCTGEALSVIKGVTSFESFLAWQKLHRKYNPKTMARAIRLMTDVTGPKQVKEIREVEAAITAWETRVRKLESEFGDSLTSTMKIAIVTGMMPTSIQDYVYTNVDGQTEYLAVVARIKAWAENKAAMMSGPVPMDVGEVHGGQWAAETEDWEGLDVQAVGAGDAVPSLRRVGAHGPRVPDESRKVQRDREGLWRLWRFQGQGQGHVEGRSRQGFRRRKGR